MAHVFLLGGRIDQEHGSWLAGEGEAAWTCLWLVNSTRSVCLSRL